MLHALIIEDNDLLRRTMQRVIEARGLTCASARTGPEGLQKADEKWPDLVVLDLGLPAPMSGWEAWQRLSEVRQDRTLRVAVLTGNSQGVLEAKRLGAAAFLKGMSVRQVIDLALRHFSL